MIDKTSRTKRMEYNWWRKLPNKSQIAKKNVNQINIILFLIYLLTLVTITTHISKHATPDHKLTETYTQSLIIITPYKPAAQICSSNVILYCNQLLRQPPKNDMLQVLSLLPVTKLLLMGHNFLNMSADPCPQSVSKYKYMHVIRRENIVKEKIRNKEVIESKNKKKEYDEAPKFCEEGVMIKKVDSEKYWKFRKRKKKKQYVNQTEKINRTKCYDKTKFKSRQEWRLYEKRLKRLHKRVLNSIITFNKIIKTVRRDRDINFNITKRKEHMTDLRILYLKHENSINYKQELKKMKFKV